MRLLVTTLALVLCCTACGSGGGGAGDSADAGASSPGSAGAGGRPLVLVRTGGLAGVHDQLRVAADGSATVQTRTSQPRPCKPQPHGLARLLSVDLAEVAAQPSRPPRIADGYSYTVTFGGRTATGSEGDDGRRAELVDAAAAVLRTCLAGGPAGY